MVASEDVAVGVEGEADFEVEVVEAQETFEAVVRYTRLFWFVDVCQW